MNPVLLPQYSSFYKCHIHVYTSGVCTHLVCVPVQTADLANRIAPHSDWTLVISISNSFQISYASLHPYKRR